MGGPLKARGFDRPLCPDEEEEERERRRCIVGTRECRVAFFVGLLLMTDRNPPRVYNNLH